MAVRVIAGSVALPPRYYHTWQLEWDERFMEIRVDGEVMLKARWTLDESASESLGMGIALSLTSPWRTQDEPHGQTPSHRASGSLRGLQRFVRPTMRRSQEVLHDPELGCGGSLRRHDKHRGLEASCFGSVQLRRRFFLDAVPHTAPG